jgi:hypothetical protein
MNGPLSDVAIEIFTKHLSFLCGQMMVLDPESAGHEMYQHGGRYQWKVEGGRTADHQGVAFKASGDSERVLANVANVLSPTFKAVLHELMAPYHDPIRDPAP